MPQTSPVETSSTDVALAGGVAWTAGAKWATQIFSWASVLIAARILSQSDFGISDMSSFFFALTNTLAEFGIGTAVLQMRELEPRVLAQLHTFSTVVCAALFLISIPFAPLVGSFFHDPHLAPLVITCNAGFLITGLQAVPLGLLQQRMDYRRLSLAEALQALVQAVGLVVCAASGLGYWSLVIAAIVAKACACARVCTWVPLEFAVPKWREIRPALTMGGQLAVARLAIAAFTQSDGITVGRILNSSLLGVYRMAMLLAAAPAEKISSLIMRATGPLFAKVQDDLLLAQRYFLILSELLMLIELPLMVGLGVIAPDAVHVVLGPKWSGVVWPLRWLILFMPIRTMVSLMDQVLVSKRKTRFTMIMSLVDLCVMPVGFVIGARIWGTTGVAAAWFALTPITILPYVWNMLRSIELSAARLAAALLPAVSGVLIMTVAVVALSYLPWLSGVAVAFRLGAEVAVGGVVYAGFQVIFFRGRLVRYTRFISGLRKGNEVATTA